MIIMSDTEPTIPDSNKRPLARFFAAGWSNLVRLMAANALFVIFNIPALVIAALLSAQFVPWLFSSVIDINSIIDPVTGNNEGVFQIYVFLVLFLLTFLVASNLICIGPFQTGFAQVYKDIRNEESVSFFDSFKAGMKKGWKKGLVSMLAGFILTPVILLAIGFYLNFRSVIGNVIAIVFIVILFAFILIQNFVYNLIISIDLSLGKIYKNAFLFVLLRYIPNLGLAFIIGVFYIAVPFLLIMSASYLTLGIFMFLYSFLVVSWVQYYISYYSGRLIEKYIDSEKA